MKLANRCAAGLVLALAFSAAGAWAQVITTIGGNPVVQRDAPDTYTALYTLDTNHPFTLPGPVNRWEIYADNTNPVQLIIYRQQGGTFVEVGSSNIETPAVGYNLFHLAQPIIVQAGDFVGTYQSGAGPTTYTGLGGCYLNLGHTILQSITTSTGFSASCDRIYSLRAFFQLP